MEAGSVGTDKLFDTLENIVNAFNQQFGGEFGTTETNIPAKQIPDMVKQETEVSEDG